MQKDSIISFKDNIFTKRYICKYRKGIPKMLYREPYIISLIIQTYYTYGIIVAS